MSVPALPYHSPEGLEGAGRLVDQHLKADQTYVELSGQLRIATHRKIFHGTLLVGVGYMNGSERAKCNSLSPDFFLVPPTCI